MIENTNNPHCYTGLHIHEHTLSFILTQSYIPTLMPEKMFAFYRSANQVYVTFLHYLIVATLKLYVFQQCCGEGVVRFRHKNNMVMVRKKIA